MAENKTQTLDASALDYIQAIEHPVRRDDSLVLLDLFAEVTGWKPVLWGSSPASAMIGYGRYDYTYDSGHSGTMFATGFAPRKSSLSIYILPGYQDYDAILTRLGKHKHGKACLYINKLADVDLDVLKELIKIGVDDLSARYTVTPS